jgi:hypothetical protein
VGGFGVWLGAKLSEGAKLTSKGLVLCGCCAVGRCCVGCCAGAKQASKDMVVRVYTSSKCFGIVEGEFLRLNFNFN